MRQLRRPTRCFSVQVPTTYGLLECIPIPITIPIYFTQHYNNNNNNSSLSKSAITTTIVEATASTQNQLVDYVLQDEQVGEVKEDKREEGSPQLRIPNEETEESRPLPRPSIQDPYGAVLWPAAQAVTSYLLSHYTSSGRSGLLDVLFHGGSGVPRTITQQQGRRRTHIIELGCGTGLISLSLYHQAIQFLKQPPPPLSCMPESEYEITIRATDYEMVPLQLVQYAAQMYPHPDEDDDDGHTNRSGSTVSGTNLTNHHVSRRTFTDGPHRVTLQTQWFDVCDMSLELSWPDDTDQVLIVVADLLYDTTTALALAQRIVSWLDARHETNVQIIIGDSPGRIGRPTFLQELQRHGYYTSSHDSSDHHDMVPPNHSSFVTKTVVMGQPVTTPRNELICGPTSVSRSSDPQPLEIDIFHF